MAPNLKQRPQLLQTAADLDLVHPIKAAFPPLTSEVAQQRSQTVEASDSNDYWNWSCDNDAEIQRLTSELEAARFFSADHIVENITRQAAAAFSSSNIVAANDQYWDWSHAPTESEEYWNWPVANNGYSTVAHPSSVEEEDAYWAW